MEGLGSGDTRDQGCGSWALEILAAASLGLCARIKRGEFVEATEVRTAALRRQECIEPQNSLERAGA